MNEKVPPTASNRIKRELAREGDLLTYKKKRKTIDPSIVIPLNTVDIANEGVSEPVPPTESAQAILGAQAEFAQAVNNPQGLEFETESAQAIIGTQPPLLNISPNSNVNIPIVGGYSEGERATRNEDVGPSDKSLLSSFRFHRASSIALGQGLNAFKSLKAGGTGNSLSLKKLKEYYAYKLVKVLMTVVWDPYRDKRDSVHIFKEVTFFYGALNAKEQRKFNPKYEWVDCFSAQKLKEVILKKVDRGRRVREGPLVYTERYLEWFSSVSWTMIYPITVDLAADDDVGIHQRKEASINEHDIGVQKFGKKNISLEAELRQKSGLEDCNQSLSIELNKKYKESESLKVVNTLLIEQIDLHLPPATPLVVLQSHQLMPNATLAKKYDNLLPAHEDVKKKFIAKEDFRKKLVNAEERMKFLEVNNSEWVDPIRVIRKSIALFA
ncbi:hypothetical protein GIB67_039747 [Kingdonia uniflora]|uniref:Uncharacterized protein n=1 Tax=Kingdonia uniflora TaxID=39325 RepID=A0A7J7MQ25_9MAGN|nr:hypothetical protein GIB67_039747 [Kingdonia uniflora]